jgi:hypothetical protein
MQTREKLLAEQSEFDLNILGRMGRTYVVLDLELYGSG